MKTYEINENLVKTIIKILSSGTFPNVSYQNLKELENILINLKEINKTEKNKEK